MQILPVSNCEKLDLVLLWFMAWYKDEQGPYSAKFRKTVLHNTLFSQCGIYLCSNPAFSLANCGVIKVMLSISIALICINICYQHVGYFVVTIPLLAVYNYRYTEIALHVIIFWLGKRTID